MKPTFKTNAAMPRKAFSWLIRCFLFGLVGAFLAIRVTDALNPIVWWGLHSSGVTMLRRPEFTATYYLPIAGIYGFCLGLVPAQRLRNAVLVLFGRLRPSAPNHPSDL